MKLSIQAGKTSQSLNLFILDSTKSDGSGLTGLVYNSAGLVAYYTHTGTNATATAITLATLASVNSAFSSGGFKEISAANMPGVYRFDIPNNAIATAKGQSVLIQLQGAANMVPVLIEIELIGWDNQLTQIAANVTQINGSSTSSNLATLKLKSLNIQSDSPTTYALDINGYDGTIGTNDGGTAIRIRGGNPYSATGNGSGGHGILLSGGSVTGSGNRGYALRASASGAGGGGGIYIDGSWGQIPLLLQGDSYTSGMKVTGGYGWIGGIQANILGNFVGNVTGSVGSISSVRPKKNTGLDNFMFPMFDSTTKNPKTGLTVTAERSIDGNPFAPCSASAVELSNGVYRVSLSAGDLNGNKIMLRFSAPGADDQLVEIITQD